MTSWTPRESLKTEESGGGGGGQLFSIDSWQPSPRPQGPFHRNTNYRGVTDYIHYSEISHLTSTPGFACVNASFKECYKPLQIRYTWLFFISTVKTRLIKGKINPKPSAYILAFPWTIDYFAPLGFLHRPGHKKQKKNRWDQQHSLRS